VLETVCPDPATAPEVEEYRLTMALLPVRLKLDQDVVAFLHAFVGCVSAAVAAVDNPMEAALAATGTEPPAPPYFQKVEIWGTGVMLDYRPRRVDIAALRDGDAMELLNLVPWGGVDLNLKPLRLIGVEGWDGLGVAAATEWLQYCARTQAHKFLTGVAPIRSVVRVGGAVAGLLAVPAAHIGQAVAKHGGSLAAVAVGMAPGGTAFAAAVSAEDSDGDSGAFGYSGSSSDMRQALRKSTSSFVKALVFEALGLGATVAAGAQMVLTGGQPVSVEPPSGVLEGLRAAAGELSEGFGGAAETLVKQPVREVRERGVKWQEAAKRALKRAPAAAVGPAQATAAALRYTLLGLRSALDPDKKMEQ
jgi:autophagy-related protein 2